VGQQPVIFYPYFLNPQDPNSPSTRPHCGWVPAGFPRVFNRSLCRPRGVIKRGPASGPPSCRVCRGASGRARRSACGPRGPCSPATALSPQHVPYHDTTIPTSHTSPPPVRHSQLWKRASSGFFLPSSPDRKSAEHIGSTGKLAAVDLPRDRKKMGPSSIHFEIRYLPAFPPHPCCCPLTWFPELLEVAPRSG